MTASSALAPRAFVIGHPIAHSRSPMLHRHWLESLGLPGRYDAVDVAPGALDAFFAALDDEGFVGGNVTVPHKLAVMPYLSRIDEAAAAIGAVNTIWREDGRMVGGNTDADGFLGNLDQLAPGWDASPGVALVMGAGGAARAAIFALLSRGFAVRVANRTLAGAREIADRFGAGAHQWDDLPRLLVEADLLVNATALGMVGKPPLDIDLAGLKPGAVVHDIVYAPLETALLRAAKARGHRTVDGLGMLLHQAVAGFARWFGVKPAVTDALRDVLERDIRAKTPSA